MDACHSIPSHLAHLGTGMDAFFRSLLIVGALSSLGAGYRTPNFIVTAPTAQFAKQVGDAAEIYRNELAIEWTGKPLPGNWSSPCPIEVTVGSMGAQGETTFNFQNGEVFGWNMKVAGGEQQILDSVLPHEVNHTIFACYFRRPLPRWADEGAASLIENESERMRLRKIHDQVMNTSRKIPLKSLLEMKNYPQEKQQVLTLYAEGHSLADFLIQRSDKRTYVAFLQMAHEQGWEAALKNLYNVESVEILEAAWDKWVLAGSPAVKLPKGTQVAETTPPLAKKGNTIRGQSPETKPAARPRLDETPRNSEQPNSDDLELQSPFRQEGLDVAETPSQRISRDTLELPLLSRAAQSGAARVPREKPMRPFSE